MRAKRLLLIIFFCMATSASAKASSLDLLKFKTSDFLLSTASTGCMPKGMKIDPVGNSLYVAEMCGKILSNKRVPSVSIFDLDKRVLAKTVITPLGVLKNGIYANTEVEFSLDEQWGLITRAEGDKNSEIYKNFGLLTVVNTVTYKIAKYIPLNGSGSKIIAARPYVAEDKKHEQLIYVANYFSDNISVVDVTNLRENGQLDGSGHLRQIIELNTSFKNPNSRAYHIAPRGIAFTPDGRYALILATETGSLIVVDAIKHQQIAEIAPISKELAGRDLNLRHIVVSDDGETAYISHMRGNAISRINLSKLIQKINLIYTKDIKAGKRLTLPESVWNELLIGFNTPEGSSKILILEDYPMDHPNFPGKKWRFSHPNTIVLEPYRNRYLYVSSRTTTNADDSKVDPLIRGKIDIIDTKKDKIVFTLVAGAQPTALEASRDGKLLISASLINDRLYFYDLKKIIDLYEKGEQ